MGLKKELKELPLSNMDSELWEGSQNQTLLRRSKRVLGDHIELGSTSSAPVSPPESSKPVAKKRPETQKTKAEPSARRREQVLRAQRTHRQRTQTYIKTLEKEVLRLRKSEADAHLKIDSLQRRIYSLVHYLSENNIPFPPNFHLDSPQTLVHDISDPSQAGRIVVAGIDTEQPSINFESVKPSLVPRPSRFPTRPGTDRNSNVYHHEHHHHHHLHDPNQNPYSQFQHSASSTQHQDGEGSYSNYLSLPLLPATPLSNQSDRSEERINNNSPINVPSSEDGSNSITQDDKSLLQDPRAAMDFILALEQPCLSHIRQSHLDYASQDFSSTDDSSLPSGHVFMASMEYMPIIQHHTARQMHQLSPSPNPNSKQHPLSEQNPHLHGNNAPRSSTPSTSMSHINQNQGLDIDPNISQSQSLVYEVTTADIDRLLQYSLNIPIQGNEIAPVQVWKHLQKLPPSYKVNKEFLAELAVELRAYVDCLHYGAVLDMARVLEILEKHFPGYPHAEMMGL
ncbi:hypothetical protein F5884DRAFT_517774 [Xylogone sp. PMI_703]|nr:hypothetical protein F5884DRAFT_517774 [Xylogone sp. PMI_703]